MTNRDIEAVADRLARAERGVAFTGAGISTESGLADFRSPGGVWARYRTVYYNEFVTSEPARIEYWRMKKELYPEFAAARPNAGHLALARLEAAGRLRGVITQNIDGLHAAAGSRNVLELHGTGRFVDCLGCGRRWPAGEIFERYKDFDAAPRCDFCGGLMKPAVVMFGEMLPQDVLEKAFQFSAEADVFVAAGSSLVVEPAASMPREAKRQGAFLAIVNRDATPLDDMADVVIRESCGEALKAIADGVLKR